MVRLRTTHRCGACGLRYRSSYRGQKPLCRGCQSRGGERSLFSELPPDVLYVLIPRLLLCPVRVTESLLDNGTRKQLIHPSWSAMGARHIISADVAPVLEVSVLPLLRIKLICKALNDATNAYMDSLLVPTARCEEAATAIQVAWFKIAGYACERCGHMPCMCDEIEAAEDENRRNWPVDHDDEDMYLLYRPQCEQYFEDEPRPLPGSSWLGGYDG